MASVGYADAVVIGGMTMRIVFGVLLFLVGFVWAAFWSAGAAMTTETGIWNSATWTVMIIAALGLIPAAGGCYLVGSALYRMLAG
jgi:hypothetical protein